jgi:hypothetical protein
VLELDEMGHEDWLLSRNKIVKLDEYLETWMNRLNESEDKSPIIDWLKNQIEQHKVFLIFLLYLDIDCVFIILIISNPILLYRLSFQC